jgi:hypothetical protein
VLAVAMVGVQKGYQRRALLDRELLRELRTLVPEPEPGTVFVPVRVEAPASASAFDLHYLNVFGSWWSARWG